MMCVLCSTTEDRKARNGRLFFGRPPPIITVGWTLSSVTGNRSGNEREEAFSNEAQMHHRRSMTKVVRPPYLEQ